MSAPFLGQIGLFGFPFAPRGWAFCQGQILSITQNPALFSLLGTYYGGNGQTTFALPNLQGNLIVGAGQGVGLSQYQLGQTGGSASVTLNQTQLPAHTHSLPATATRGTLSQPSGALAATSRGIYPYSPSSGDSMSMTSVGLSGGSQPHNNLMPFLGLNYCICLQGIYPSRP